MSSQRPSRWLLALIAGAMILPTLVFLAGLPWLQQHQALAFLVAGVTAIVVISAGLAFSFVAERRQDEWSRSGSRFASHWGVMIGTCLTGALLVSPVIQDALVSFVTRMTDDDTDPRYRAVILAYSIGFCTVVVIQGLCSVVLHIGWKIRMSSPGQDPS
jgi:hypothetical protein